jgi:hydrogenase expression/formation protein HypC
MCLAIPMKVTCIEGVMATCEARGILRKASLFLIQHEGIAVGDHVLIQSGHITAKVSADEAAGTWELYDQILAAEAAERTRL